MNLIKNEPEKLLEALQIGSIKKDEMEGDVKTEMFIALDYLQWQFASFEERKEVYRIFSQFNCPQALAYLERYLKIKSDEEYFEDRYWIVFCIAEFKGPDAKKILCEAFLTEQNEYVIIGLRQALDRFSNH